VSVVIPTWDNYRLLAERSLPSVLAQSYQHFEVIVIGDAAPPQAADAVAAIGDRRFSYANLTHRSLYPTDPKQMWRVGGVPAANEALARAQGRWIAMLNDDDAFRPHHLESLLALARRDRLELVYGKLLCHMPSGASVEVGEFPPRYGQFGLQGAMFHGDLADFGFELADALFGLPGDWGLTQRMLRAGARVGMLPDVVTDYFPATEFTPRAGSEHPGHDPSVNAPG
jgi:succinoglycan biosynthesis protein ExoO